MFRRVISPSQAAVLAPSRPGARLRAAAPRRSQSTLAIVLAACTSTYVTPAFSLDVSTGPLGVHVYDADGMPIIVGGIPYLGTGTTVYVVENYRPANPGTDSDTLIHTNVDPINVFETHLFFGAVGDQALDNHPERVAGIIISDNPVIRGVAPEAALIAIAFTNSDGADRGEGEIADGIPPGGVNNVGDKEVHIYAAAATQSIVSGNSPDVRTIPVNLSFGLQGNEDFSFTNFLDWSSTTHNVLYVATAGNVGQAGLIVPRNHFNGLTVGGTCNGVSDGSSCVSITDVPYNRISPTSLAPVDGDGRRLVDLVAPGEDITSTILGDAFSTAGGTSFAAPHATGAATLLQQFAEVQIAMATPGFNTSAYQHQVMKAVLMNSADKREDTGDGLLLDMENTILRSNDMDWIDQRAIETDRDAIPLDVELGTGALNARRAFRQFIPGEQNPGAVPNLGWDFENTDMPDTDTIYDLEVPLVAGSYVAITLAWDRSVGKVDSLGDMEDFDAELFRDDGVLTPSGETEGENDKVFTEVVIDPVAMTVVTEPFIDLNDNDEYDHGLSDTFTFGGPANLDLYLMPTGSTDLGDAIALSNSTLYSEEHIFAQVSTAGLYSIWVRHVGTIAGELGQNYGLAWWTVPVPEPRTLVLFVLGLCAFLLGVSQRV